VSRQLTTAPTGDRLTAAAAAAAAAGDFDDDDDASAESDCRDSLMSRENSSQPLLRRSIIVCDNASFVFSISRLGFGPDAAGPM
jgi:hypothetical protein